MKLILIALLISCSFDNTSLIRESFSYQGEEDVLATLTRTWFTGYRGYSESYKNTVYNCKIFKNGKIEFKNVNTKFNKDTTYSITDIDLQKIKDSFLEIDFFGNHIPKVQMRSYHTIYSIISFNYSDNFNQVRFDYDETIVLNKLFLKIENIIKVDRLIK